LKSDLAKKSVQQDNHADSDTSGRSRPTAGRTQQHKVLYRISDLINSTVNSNTLLRRIVRETAEAFEASGGLIAFADEDQQLRVDVDQRLDARNLRTGTILTADHLADKAFRADALLHYELHKPAPKTEMAAPLRVEGKPIGVLCVRWAKARRITENDERLLTAVAAQASRVIHTSRLYDRLAKQTSRLESLFEVAQNLISTDPLSEVLNRVTEALLTILDVKQCTVLLVGKGHDLQLSASSGGEGGTYTQRREVGDSLVQKLSSRGEPVRVLDVKKLEDRRPGKAPKIERTTSLLAVPIFYQNALVGILNVYTAKPRDFESEEMRLLKAYASLCGVAIENARQHERLLSAAEEIRVTERANTMQALASESGRLVRNALTSSRLMLDTLHEEGGFPPGRGEDYELLLQNIDTIDNVVSTSHQIAARRQPLLEWINVNQTVDEVLALARHRLTARQIMIHRRFTSELPRVLIDPGELQQVILQVINNALDGMRNGGLLNISTTLLDPSTTQSNRPMVRINIRDTGAGIHPDIADNLMEPFSRRSDARVGVALFVASRVIRKYGGRFTVRNASDHGTSVSITLPALES
jgi:GAF domain-containing protein